VWVAGIAFALFVIGGCSQANSASSRSSGASTEQTAPTLLRIGYQKSSALLNLLRVRKTLERKLGPRVQVVWQEFAAGPQLLEGLNVGSIDFGVTGEAPPVFAQAAGAPLLYVATERAGPATEAILVRSDSPYKSLADLKGKRIALNKASNVHYFLVRALEKAGLQYDDVEPTFLTPADARAAFESGRVDAWVIWDPYYAATAAAGDARLLMDGTGLVENRAFYLATRQFVADQRATLDVLLSELRTMNDWADAHRDEVADFLAAALQMDPQVFRVVERRRKYGIDTMRPPIVAYQQQVADTFLHLGLIPHGIRVQDATWNPP
jgi:sulfonate transport system substrate-binding protein